MQVKKGSYEQALPIAAPKAVLHIGDTRHSGQRIAGPKFRVDGNIAATTWIRYKFAMEVEFCIERGYKTGNLLYHSFDLSIFGRGENDGAFFVLKAAIQSVVSFRRFST